MISQTFIEANIIRQFFTIHTFQIANLRFFKYLRRNFYLRRSSKIFQNSEESSSSSLVFFLSTKILRLRLRSIFDLRCNTALHLLLSSCGDSALGHSYLQSGGGRQRERRGGGPRGGEDCRQPSSGSGSSLSKLHRICSL